MTNMPPSTEADARSRAWRTLAQGLAVDLVATLAAALVVALADIEWTSTVAILTRSEDRVQLDPARRGRHR